MLIAEKSYLTIQIPSVVKVLGSTIHFSFLNCSIYCYSDAYDFEISEFSCNVFTFVSPVRQLIISFYQ